MRRIKAGVAGLFALCALSAGLLTVYQNTPVAKMVGNMSAASASPAAVLSCTPDAHARHTLFPEVDESSVTHVTVSSQDASYEFLRDAPDDVSVNGQKADSEAFDTLLCQIVTLPVSDTPSFPVSESPLLTVRVVSGETMHLASFYRGQSEDKALILCGTQEAPLYRQTSAWRVGTLLLTCEGTRIQDERGNETPAQ